MVEQVLLAFLTRADSRFRTLFGQWDHIKDIHGLSDREALHAAHHFHIIAGLGMHHHLNQGHSRYLTMLKVVWVLLPWSLISDEVGHALLVPREEILVTDRILELKTPLGHGGL